MTRKSKREIESRLDEIEGDEEMDTVERWRAWLRGDLTEEGDNE